MFALGENCEHSHQENSCITCLICFSFFKSKVLPFLNNINDEVSTNHMDKVATMMYVVPKISYEVTHYDSHCICANLQFSAIEKIPVNENRSNHHLYVSGPQFVFADDISRGTGLLFW